MRLRYQGATAITFFMEKIGTLEPGDEFTVSDELAPAFLSRQDIVQVKPERVKRVKATTPDPVADTPAAAEDQPTT